jgi:hypothetical protein
VPRLHIIDQSLCSNGGHHFDYVNCIARAASKDQFETFVATNRRFKRNRESSVERDDSLHSIATVVPSFRNTTYQRESWLSGLRHLKRAKMVDEADTDRAGKTSSIIKCAKWYRAQSFRNRRRKLISQFACDCSRFFETIPKKEFMPDDHVFLTTVSELELMGLAIYLASSPSSRLANWHLQFHYNLFDGRTPEFETQSEVQRKVRGCFLAALSRVPDHKLNFYCTSSELVEQYSRLKVAEFYRMPYPVNERFAPTVSGSARSDVIKLAMHVGEDYDESATTIDVVGAELPLPRIAQPTSPIRMGCPGELRREKGSAAHLQRVIDSLWGEYLSCGRLQVALQRPKRKMLRKEKLELELPSGEPIQFRDPVVDYLQHPLSENDYCDFIRGSDFGLLLYDSRAYYSRRAGVLGELLACGKPVIVPAGCWLAHQLQEPQFRHIDSMMQSMQHSNRLELGSLQFDIHNVPLSGGLVSFDRKRHPFRATASKTTEENIAIVSFDWRHPRAQGVDARIRCIETCRDGSVLESTQIVGHRFSSGQCRAIFRVEKGGEKICFEFENAFHDSTATIGNLSVDLYDVPDASEIPLGRVGLIFADAESIDDAVVEMVEHLDHYRQSAQEFSHPWWRMHDPNRTLEFMVGGRDAGRRVA